MNLAERGAATEEVLKRFRDKPFSWQGANCIRLARAQAAALGHPVPPVPLFRSATGAKAALAKQGCASVTELLDRHFRRLPGAAFLLLGDLAVLRGEDDHGGLEAVCVSDGRGNLIGWHGSDLSRLSTIKFAQADVTVAWRL